jgi:glycosyltransferase involved in cell wall biosynthesis
MTLDRPRVLTWPVHGSYLQYLALATEADFLVVESEPGELSGYPPNVIGVPPDRLEALDADVVLYQTLDHWNDRGRLLPERLHRAPSAYLEHDPPRQHPTDTRHPAADSGIGVVVHVTHYNALMWDTGASPTTVIEHGVPDPGIGYDGSLARGIVVINDLATRGRRLGRDVFEDLRTHVPLDLVGMKSELLGGLGEVKLPELPRFLARYRFCFSPIRYTSLGLGILEAMAVGLPVVGLATTELPSVIRDGENGYVSNDRATVIERMRELLADRELARRIGGAGQETVRARFGLDRFGREWAELFRALARSAQPADPSSVDAHPPEALLGRG